MKTRFIKLILCTQSHQAWIWKGLMAAAFFMTIGTSKAFADASSCANPWELILNPWELILDKQVKMKFCDIPAAQDVLIGSENGEIDERPVYGRDFKEFQMAQVEVTQLQYKTVVGSEPWKENGQVKSGVQEGNDNPASHVSYEDAQQVASALSVIDQTATYRLPTEAEFEYAARAGTTSNYYWGDAMAANFAYFKGNSEGYPRKVDSCPMPLLDQKYPGYCANDFGLYHMLGNVYEWTADAYHSYYESYRDGNRDGNVARTGTVHSPRVFRGGGWLSDAQYLRSASRGAGGPAYRNGDVGFRLVRIAK